MNRAIVKALNQLSERLNRMILNPPDNPYAEKASWDYTRKGYDLSKWNFRVTGMLAAVSVVLTIIIMTTDRSVENMKAVLSMLAKQDTALNNSVNLLTKEDTALRNSVKLLAHTDSLTEEILGSFAKEDIRLQKQISLLIKAERLLKRENDLTQKGTDAALNQLNTINKSAEDDYKVQVSSFNTMLSKIISLKEAFELNETAKRITMDNYLTVYEVQIKFVEDIADVFEPQISNKFVLSNDTLTSAIFQFSNKKSVTLFALKLGTPLDGSSINKLDSIGISTKALYFQAYQTALHDFLNSASFMVYREEERLHNKNDVSNPKLIKQKLK